MKTQIRSSLIRLAAIFLICGQTVLSAADKAKVVFISGKPSHGPMAHEHRAGNLLLAKAPNAAELSVNAVVLPENGYPADPSVLEDAARSELENIEFLEDPMAFTSEV